jgi:hypothetical protein
MNKAPHEKQNCYHDEGKIGRALAWYCHLIWFNNN